MVRRATLRRRLRYAGTFVGGLALGTLALFVLNRSASIGVDRTLVATAAFVNLMGNDKEIRITAAGGKGRFGMALGFRGDGPVVEWDPGIGKHTRFEGVDRQATFLLPKGVTSIYLVVTDTPAEAIVRKYFNDRIEAGPPFDDAAKTMEKLKDHLLGLGYATLDIQKVISP